MRYSKQRETIQEIVQMNPVHPTADWVYEQAKKAIPNISLGTVYRNLNQLVDGNLINAIKYDGIVRYDGNTDTHSHFICQDCNRLFDIYIPVEEMISQISENCNHFITGGQFQVTGKCEDCKKSN